ncbi:MAG: tRNA (adenosine(37)-N6)-threonylcarbamoyltransferase complex transferase subunit TsaD, partial [Oscillospiraceae bacterium]|nr:tRNA (adenosine(37)-N6)-threonylcarbamoyltransferase complex transferase subunit TsaD [Oscillospiraceae bacterium]
MKILAIETSCDETAAALVQSGKKIEILSNIVASQAENHAVFGGVVPEIASRLHCETISQITNKALSCANCSFTEVDAIAVTFTPGLIGALLVGVNYAKGLCFALDKPLIPVNHIKAHIAANYINRPGLKPPFLSLVVSGGHNHIIEVIDYTSFKLIGRTRDDAAGEAFDKVARMLGLGYPGGAVIEAAAHGGDRHANILPHPKSGAGQFDFSFSGLKTAVLNLVHNCKQRGEKPDTAGIAASFQETVCEILTEKFFAAAKELGYTELVLAGGVSANQRLRERMTEESEKTGIKLYCPPLYLCGD